MLKKILLTNIPSIVGRRILQTNAITKKGNKTTFAGENEGEGEYGNTKGFPGDANEKWSKCQKEIPFKLSYFFFGESKNFLP